MRRTTSSAGSFVDPGRLECASPDRVPQPGAQGNHQLQGAGNAQDDAHPVAVERSIRAVPGVIEGLAGDQEAQELGRVGRFDGVRCDPELQSGKLHGRQKAAATGVGSVRRLGITRQVVGDRPVGVGHIGDRVHSLADTGPVAREALRLGKQTAHADDGHRDLRRRVGRIQIFALSPVFSRQYAVGMRTIRGGLVTLNLFAHPIHTQTVVL